MIATYKVLSAILSYPTAELQAAAHELIAALNAEKLLSRDARAAVGNLLSGIAADDLLVQWRSITAHQHVEIAGLMTMAPLVDDPERARPTFRGLRQLRDELRQRTGDATLLPELSMGMSNDFEVAIEEGATLYRIGSLLFEGLESARPDGPRLNG